MKKTKPISNFLLRIPTELHIKAKTIATKSLGKEKKLSITEIYVSCIEKGLKEY